MEHKINTAKKIRYVAKNFTTGLSDVTLNVRQPDGTLFDFGSGTDLILTEKWNGEYEGSYTPDSIGVWQELITSAINGDKAVRSYTVTLIDLATVKSGLDTVEGKVDTIDTVVDGIATNVATRASQASVDVIDSNIDSIKTTVETLDLELAPGGYFSN